MIFSIWRSKPPPKVIYITLFYIFRFGCLGNFGTKEEKQTSLYRKRLIPKFSRRIVANHDVGVFFCVVAIPVNFCTKEVKYKHSIWSRQMFSN